MLWSNIVHKLIMLHICLHHCRNALLRAPSVCQDHLSHIFLYSYPQPWTVHKIKHIVDDTTACGSLHAFNLKVVTGMIIIYIKPTGIKYIFSTLKWNTPGSGLLIKIIQTSLVKRKLRYVANPNYVTSWIAYRLKLSSFQNHPVECSLQSAKEMSGPKVMNFFQNTESDSKQLYIAYMLVIFIVMQACESYHYPLIWLNK